MPQRKVGNARRLLPLALALFVGACESPLEPVSLVQPTLESLVVGTAESSTGGVLRIKAVPQDPFFSAAANERIPLLIRTASGETGTLLLRPAICRARNGTEHFCDRFLVVVRDGFDVEQLASYAAALPGRLLLSRVVSEDGQEVFTSRSFAAVELLEGDLERAMEQARRWPQVRYVEYSGFARLGSVGGTSASNHLTAAVAVESLHTRAAGGLSLRAGEEISLEYEQPDGSRLTTTVVLPTMP